MKSSILFFFYDNLRRDTKFDFKMRAQTFAISAAIAAAYFGHAVAQDVPPNDMLGGSSEGLEIPEDVSLI